jgi:hypothetical protein
MRKGRNGMHVAVIDIGKPDKNLGWAIRGAEISVEGTDLDLCIDGLAQALGRGPLALGFEAPLFVPVRGKASDLTKARDGECAKGINRPFSAGPGASVLVTALTVVPYVLAGLRFRVPAAVATLDWRKPLSNNGLLIFEAFVTNQKKTVPSRHVEDALLAIAAFQEEMAVSIGFASSVNESNCFSLIGSMLMRTGWATDPTVLSQQCLVVRP